MIAKYINELISWQMMTELVTYRLKLSDHKSESLTQNDIGCFMKIFMSTKVKIIVIIFRIAKCSKEFHQ